MFADAMVGAVVCASVIALGSDAFAGGGYLPLAPFLLPKEWVGCSLSIACVASCVALVLAGPLVDRLGSLFVLRRGLELQVVALVLTAASTTLDSIWPHMLARLIWGAAGSIIFNACIALVADYYKEPQRTQHVGTILGASVVGSLMGTPITSSAFAFVRHLELPLRTAAAFSPALLLTVVAYMALLCVPLRPQQEPLLQADVKADPKANPSKGSLLGNLFGVYRAVGRQGLLLAAMLISVFGCESAVQCAVVLDLKDRGLSSAIIGYAFIPSLMVSALASPLAGHLADQPQRRRGLLIGSSLLISSGTIAVLVAASLLDPGGVMLRDVLINVVCCLGLSLIDAPSISMMIELAESKGIGNGQATTASELAVQVGASMGPYLGSLAYRIASVDLLCWTIVGISLLIAVASALLLEAGLDGAKSEDEL